jgi:hypothetical protein
MINYIKRELGIEYLSTTVRCLDVRLSKKLAELSFDTNNLSNELELVQSEATRVLELLTKLVTSQTRAVSDQQLLNETRTKQIEGLSKNQTAFNNTNTALINKIKELETKQASTELKLKRHGIH